PAKVGIINIQGALAGTKEGQKAAADLQARFDPKRKELEKKQSEIEQRRTKVNTGGQAMAAEAREKLMREIDQLTKSLNRDTEDAQAELEQEQGKVMQELFQRMQAVIDKYARDNGYALILDVSSQQSPVIFAANGIEVTGDIVALYDKNPPGAAAAPAARPSVPSPVKKTTPPPK
ncbi:MAG: OmpH family outer membrane protein, partial [Bryobacteraceae bacterium]